MSIPTPNFRDALRKATASTLSPVLLGVGLLLLLFLAAQLSVLPSSTGQVLAPVLLLSATLHLVGWAVLRRVELPLQMANLVAFGILACLALTIYLQVMLIGDPHHTINALLLTGGSGALLLSRRWLLLSYAGIAPMYKAAAQLRPPDEAFEWWWAFVSAMGFGVIVQAAIRQLVARHAALEAQAVEHERELRQSFEDADLLRERLDTALQGTNDGIWDWDLGTNILSVSDRWNLIVGLGEEDAERHIEDWAARLHPADRDRVEQSIMDHVRGRSPRLEVSYRLQVQPGEYRVVLMRGLAHRDPDGRAYRLAGSLSDFTHTEAHDPHTGLPGQAVLLERTALAIERWRRSQHGFAVFQVDLGGLSEIGESLSSRARDQFLIAAAERLENQLRATDLVSRTSALSRTGRDQFTMLMEGIRHPHQALEVAQRIQALFDDPFRIDGTLVKADLRIGIAFGGDGDAEDFVRHAGIAARHARATGQGEAIFDHELEYGAQRDLQIESELREALASRSIHVHYQPILDLETSAVIGAEALARWHHPEHGEISPGRFVPIAERSDLIVDLDLAVLEQACFEAADWGIDSELSLHVNVSARTYLARRFPKTLESVLRSSGFTASRLTIELTESLVMESGGLADRRLAELRELGVQTALDDFGTGHSSLARLDQFDLDILKIDRAFLRGQPDSRQWRLVRTIVSLGRNLGLEVIAEGVETESQLRALKDAGCPLAQGFLFSKPLPPTAFRALLLGRTTGVGPVRLDTDLGSLPH